MRKYILSALSAFALAVLGIVAVPSTAHAADNCITEWWDVRNNGALQINVGYSNTWSRYYQPSPCFVMETWDYLYPTSSHYWGARYIGAFKLGARYCVWIKDRANPGNVRIIGNLGIDYWVLPIDSPNQARDVSIEVGTKSDGRTYCKA